MIDPCEEIVPQPVDPENKPHVDDETPRRCSPRSMSATVSKVLDDDNLLMEILLRIGFPTTLVCAAAVCRRWLQHASNRVFLRRFRELHPPRLLGFYINTATGLGIPRFVPMLPQPPELAAVIRQAGSSFDTYQSDSSATSIVNCWNGNALIDHYYGSSSTRGVHRLMFPKRGMKIVPPCPLTHLPEGKFYSYERILSREIDHSLSYLIVVTQPMRDRKCKFHIHTWQDGVWCMQNNFCIEHLPSLHLDLNPVLVGTRIYMPAAKGDIVVLDLTDSSFSIVQLPQGVEYGERNIILSQPDNVVGVYLIHVKELQLRIWLHNGDDWLLMDTICLREMSANMSLLDSSSLPQVIKVGDNAEFVFLEMERWLLHLDIKYRTMRKVYAVTRDDQCLDNIFPFMMIWPPTFPAPKDDPSRFVLFYFEQECHVKITASCLMDGIYTSDKLSSSEPYFLGIVAVAAGGMGLEGLLECGLEPFNIFLIIHLRYLQKRSSIDYLVHLLSSREST